jgi:hypothetical protein
VCLPLPARAVFDELIDWQGHAKWVPLTRVEILKGDGGPGTEFIATSGIWPAALPDRMRVDSLDADAMTVRVTKFGPVLTGDVHHTALYRRPLTASQSIYELTSSPFSSGSWAAAESEKASDPCVVAGTIVGTQNYCQIAVNGPKDARALVIKCYDKTNACQWEQTIPSAALR